MNIINANLTFKDMTWGNKPDKITLHHAEKSICTPQDIQSWHLANGWAGCGYHYFIRKDGTIYACRPIEAVGSHCFGHNTNNIGICAEGEYMHETMPEIQKKSIIELCLYLKKKYNIKQIYKHKELYNTDCPGINYPFEEIKKCFLNEVSSGTLTIDGGGISSETQTSINLIIKNFSSNIKSIFAYVDSEQNASWAFSINPPNSNYTKLEKNCSKIISKRSSGNIFSPNAFYKITAKGFDDKGNVVATTQIVLKVPEFKKKDEKLYRVQVGAYRDKSNAEVTLEQLKNKGFQGYIKQ